MRALFESAKPIARVADKIFVIAKIRMIDSSIDKTAIPNETNALAKIMANVATILVISIPVYVGLVCYSSENDLSGTDDSPLRQTNCRVVFLNK